MSGDRTVASLDLNLLVTLDTLLRERNVTRSGELLGVSQPAVSAALARLRRHFGDDLLVRAGRRYQLTPLAAKLVAHTGPALSSVRRVFDMSAGYDPHSSDREFRLVVSDYTAALLGHVLSRRLCMVAPGVVVHLEHNNNAVVANASELLKTVDGFVLPHGHLTDADSVDLYEDRWVCIVSADNDAVGDRLTLDLLRRLPWVFAYQRATALTPAAAQLAAVGIEPKVVMVAENFMPLPFLVAGTPRIALMHERLARMLAPTSGVRILDLPFAADPLVQSLWWHPTYRDDPAHVWLRELLVDCGRQLDAPSASARCRRAL